MRKEGNEGFREMREEGNGEREGRKRGKQ